MNSLLDRNHGSLNAGVKISTGLRVGANRGKYRRSASQRLHTTQKAFSKLNLSNLRDNKLQCLC